MILVTGAGGFIGANFALDWLQSNDEPILVLDKLTYASNIKNLDPIKNDKRFTFVKGDINDKELIKTLLEQYQPRAVINFAAESHVDRSITSPEDFIKTNINGVFNLLEVAKNYWQTLTDSQKENFRFLQVSTDEVYGSLDLQDPPFKETTPYSPNSPYSASKAAADHLVNAYHHTYGLPTLITNCSNNYGPYQFPEKLIPFMIISALNDKPLRVYGDGMQIRDWLYVGDHCDGIKTVLAKAPVGKKYNIGGKNEKTNLDVVKTICTILDELQPRKGSYADLITHVTDRPGHDRRYAIDASKIEKELQWQPKESFETGIYKTVHWYIKNLTHFDGTNIQ